jgi:endonuclease/exonuclease/phosphatase family metal-dependent hydrolase
VSGSDWQALAGLTHPFLELRFSSIPLTVFGVHLRPRFTASGEKARVREVAHLLEASHRLGNAPHLFVGDFNAVAPGDEVRIDRMAVWMKYLIRLNGGRIPRKAVRGLLDAGYVDGFRRISPEQPGFTFSTQAPCVRLDYVFASAAASGSLRECRAIRDPESAARASDHYPLLAVLDL